MTERPGHRPSGDARLRTGARLPGVIVVNLRGRSVDAALQTCNDDQFSFLEAVVMIEIAVGPSLIVRVAPYRGPITGTAAPEVSGLAANMADTDRVPAQLHALAHHVPTWTINAALQTCNVDAALQTCNDDQFSPGRLLS